MQVKLIYDDYKTDWTSLTVRQHIELQKQPPVSVEIRIDDFYPDSPDAGETAIVSFEVFNLLARDSVLEENRQRKQIWRNCDIRPIENISPQEYSFRLCDPEAELIRLELRQNLDIAMDSLTPLQRRRLDLAIDGLTVKEIAKIESVHHTAVSRTFREIRKRFKNF